MPTGSLPKEGKALWEKVYQRAKKGSCKGDEECAARTAWSAVKGAGWKKDKEGNWHKASMAEFSLTIVKAAYDKATGEMRWSAVASDTDWDSYEERMSLELFTDFVARAESGIVVLDDFAHHPTAVRETVEAVKSGYPGRRLIAVFEPRTNSSMRKVFQPVYPLAFDGADVVCIRRPSMLEKIPAAERFSSEELVDELNRRGKAAGFFADTDQIIDHLVQTAVSGDVILVMSNGGFDNIHERLLASL